MNKIEGIMEALSFIRTNWIGKTLYWSGSAGDFIGAVRFGGVVMGDIEDLIEAINNNEPTPVEGVSGIIHNGKLMTVTVVK